MIKMLFSLRSARNDEVSRVVSAAITANAEASDLLTQTIREMLEENDRVTGRIQNVDKPRF